MHMKAYVYDQIISSLKNNIKICFDQQNSAALRTINLQRLINKYQKDANAISPAFLLK